MAPGREVEAGDHHAAVRPPAREHVSAETGDRFLCDVRVRGECPPVKLNALDAVAALA
jgi:hypothetical protein